MSSNKKRTIVAFLVAVTITLLLGLDMGNQQRSPSEINSYSTKSNRILLRARNLLISFLNSGSYETTTIDGYILRSLTAYSLPRSRDDFFALFLNKSSFSETNRTLLLQYRKEFQQGSTEVGLPENMICTKQNTNKDQKLQFLFSLGKATVNQHIWNLFPEKSIFNYSRQFKKCSIVGNSGILLNSRCGKQIDDADFVLRCNLPSLEGYEDDVGKRVDLVTANPSQFKSKFGGSLSAFIEDINNYDGTVWVPAFTVSQTFDQTLQAANMSATKYGKKKMVWGNPLNYLAVWNMWKALGHQDTITTGFYMVTSLLTVCDETHLYGFWPFGETANGSFVPYHYHDSISMSFIHDTDGEFSILWRLHELNLINLHVDPCL